MTTFGDQVRRADMVDVTGQPPNDTEAASTRDRSAFYREGEYWTIAYAGTVIRLRDAKGLHCLAHLLRHPGHGFSTFELLEVPHAPSAFQALTPPGTHAPEEARVVVTKRIKAAIKKIQAHHPSLGYHLSTTVKTGALCIYAPDPERPVAWTESRRIQIPDSTAQPLSTFLLAQPSRRARRSRC